MKRYLYLALCLFGIIGCSEDKIDLYQSDRYISFVNKEADTISVSFFLLGNLQEYDLPVAVRLTGDPLQQPEAFSCKMSNGDSKYYDLAQPEFQAMSHLDTFYVKLKNSPELQENTINLCLELAENANFKLGDRYYRRIHLKVNDNVLQPSWWTDDVENFYLGAFSKEKYGELMLAANYPDLSEVTDGLIRSWALALKYHLEERATSPEGPVLEADGSAMTVPVKG